MELWERGPYNRPIAVVDSLSPASPVIAVTVLLTSLLPAPLEAVTVMVYLLPGSSPVIVCPVKLLLVTVILPSSLISGQTSEVSLHIASHH